MKSSDKFQRMALRLAAGNRLPAPAKVSGGGPAYLVAHACFACHKSFKLLPREQPVTCPNCGGELHQMGQSFKAPVARDAEQWAKVEALYRAGFRFFSCRSHECPPLPAKLTEVEQFISENPGHPFRVRGT